MIAFEIASTEAYIFLFIVPPAISPVQIKKVNYPHHEWRGYDGLSIFRFETPIQHYTARH